MEYIFIIIFGIAILFLYISIAKFLFGKFVNSKGKNKIFWLVIIILTFSFLFGRTEKESTADYNNCGGEDQEKNELDTESYLTSSFTYEDNSDDSFFNENFLEDDD